jgi:cytochrome c biogenesis factor
MNSDTLTASYETVDPLTVGQWVVVLLILAVPIVNILALLVWSFNDSTHPSKRNYARANLIIMAVLLAFVALIVLIVSFIGVAGGGLIT